MAVARLPGSGHHGSVTVANRLITAGTTASRPARPRAVSSWRASMRSCPATGPSCCGCSLGHGRRGRTGRLPSSPLHISTGTQGGGQVGGRRCDSVAVIIAGARGSDDARIGDARQRLAAAQVAGKGVRILPLTAACAAAATGGSRVAIATAGAARSAPDGVGRARANRPRTAARRQGCRRAGAAGPGAGRRVGRGCTD
jgi:hypothetical protein